MKIILHQNNTYVVRFDRGEEVMEGLQRFCEERNIEAGSFSAIGAAKEFTVSYYDVARKEYKDKHITEGYEIVGVLGNVTRMENKTIIHAHGCFSDVNMQVVAGHIKKLVVAATCEVSLHAVPGTIKRTYSPEIGLNLME